MKPVAPVRRTFIFGKVLLCPLLPLCALRRGALGGTLPNWRCISAFEFQSVPGQGPGELASEQRGSSNVQVLRGIDSQHQSFTMGRWGYAMKRNVSKKHMQSTHLITDLFWRDDSS